MTEWIKSFELWQVIVGAGSIAGFLAFLIAVIASSGLKIEATTKGIKVTPEKKNKKEEPAAVVNGSGQHKDCLLRRDFILVVEYTTEAIGKINHIRDIYTIKDQMNYAEMKISEIRAMLRRRFLKLLRAKTGSRDGLVGTHEAHDYENVLRIMDSLVRDEFRFIFRENHLPEKTDIELDGYLRDKAIHLATVTTELFNEAIPPGFDPSGEEIYEANKDIRDKIDSIVENVIRRGRAIAIE